MIRRIGRQLLLPVVQQFAAQQGDQCHGQEDEAEGQGLPSRRERTAQQLA